MSDLYKCSSLPELVRNLYLHCMKFVLFSLFITSTFTVLAEGSLTIEGSYQGKNIYVQNPISDDGDAFCATAVIVNAQVLSDLTLSSAFEIKLDQLGLKIGDPVLIEIKHHDGCKPKVLNPPSQPARGSRNIESGSLEDGILRWKGDGKKYAFSVEQYRWNKWVTVDVSINRPDREGFYSVDLSNSVHSGENTFRVISKDSNGAKSPSREFKMTGSTVAVEFNLMKSERLLKFSESTSWELYNAIGDFVDNGTSEQIDLSRLDAGVYYLNFDNQNAKIKLK